METCSASRVRRLLFGAVALSFLGAMVPATALPPDLPGIDREQALGVPSPPDALLRIWLIGVGQGDAILIELPPPVSEALGNPAGDPVQLLVDGGAAPIDLATRTPLFLHRLHPNQVITIEHMILTHHDRDHVAGLTRVLEDDSIRVDHVYGSGLAAFRPGVRDIPTGSFGGGFVGKGKRALGRFDASGELEDKYLVTTLDVLRERVTDNELTSDFGAFAKQIAAKSVPAAVQSYEQACLGCGALDVLATAATPSRPAFRITTLWPMPKPRRYSDWGKTTNGNSVAFRLDYGAFSMLFTGDLNENCQPDLLHELDARDLGHLLEVDVLKAPHHGSSHNAQEFLDPQVLRHVLTVASMGGYGFVETNYRHPSESTIRALGGAGRFYSTYIHERDFDRESMTDSELDDMVEDTHVLIETDGEFFRIVEVRRTGTPTIQPVESVPSTRGTRWIRAH